MKYLFIFEDGTMEQTNNLGADDLKAVHQGTLEVIQFEKDRGFCKVLTESDDRDNVFEQDWERISVQ